MEYLSDAEIRPEEMFGKISKTAAGSVLLHYAIVRRRTGDLVTAAIEYVQSGDAAAELAGIAGEIRGKWAVEDLLLVRRVGRLQVGAIIASVGVSCARSRDAFEACQYGVERLKQMKTVRKTESYEP
jgi:molybdopterin synthase catalytic subunit